MDDAFNQLRRIVQSSRQAFPYAGVATSNPDVNRVDREQRDLGDLRQNMRDRLKALDSTAPGYERLAQRAFVVSVLVWQFGPDLLQDKRASAMIDSIEQAIQTQPDVSRRLTSLIAELTAE